MPKIGYNNIWFQCMLLVRDYSKMNNTGNSKWFKWRIDCRFREKIRWFQRVIFSRTRQSLPYPVSVKPNHPGCWSNTVFTIMPCRSQHHISTFQTFWTLTTVRNIINYVYTQWLTDTEDFFEIKCRQYTLIASPNPPYPLLKMLAWPGFTTRRSCDPQFETLELLPITLAGQSN